MEMPARWAHLQDGTFSDLLVEEPRSDAELAVLVVFLLHGYSEVWRTALAGDAVVAHHPVLVSGQVQVEGKVLARLETGQLTLERLQVDRFDAFGLQLDAGNLHLAVADVPTGLALELFSNVALAVDEDVRQKAVCLAPGRKDVVRGRVAENLLHRAQQHFAHNGIQVRADVETHMLLRDPLDCRQQHSKVVDVFCVRVHRVGQ
mmetsp:Transcript_6419/g.19423  ORF Transcript_6419/g.19423 Transcript_6419/m.19423 type:complete len:204 (-) Transcript_6419:198-809(-)